MAFNAQVEHVFIVNGSELEWRGCHDRIGYIAEPGKLLRVEGANTKPVQFPMPEAALLIGNLPPNLRGLFKTTLAPEEVKKEDLVPVKVPKDQQAIENAPGQEYPGTSIDMSWNERQCREFLRVEYPEIHAKLRATTAVETMVLAVWSKTDPARAKRYKATVGGK